MRKLFDRVRSGSGPGRAHAGLMLIGLASAAWQAIAAEPKKADGLYSEVRAARGGGLYQQHCSACHSAQLQGSPAVPLTGEAFRARWEDRQHTLDDLYYIIRAVRVTSPGSGLPVKVRGGVRNAGGQFDE
jgi:mono/diheme cytochrome c family protein